MRGTVLDDKGEILRQFEGKIPIIVSYNLAKNVPVFASTKGKPLDDYYVKEIKFSMPNVRVLGSRNVLDGIKSVSTEVIDITDKSETFITPLVTNLPKGATILEEDAERLTAEVIIEKYITRNINMSPGHVSIFHGDNTGNMSYRVTNDAIPITVKGKSEDVNAIKATDIRLSINVSDLCPRT